jgi:hypothetical protein
MTENKQAEYVTAFAELTVPLLRARAASAGIAGRSKMNKAELVGVLADFEVAQQRGVSLPSAEAARCGHKMDTDNMLRCPKCRAARVAAEVEVTEDDHGNRVVPESVRLTSAQRRALENVFADRVDAVRVDVAFCTPAVRGGLEQLGLVRRSRWDLTDEGLRVVAAMNVTPRKSIYDSSDVSWAGDTAYVDRRQA